MAEREPVAILGLGAVTPAGSGVDGFWAGLLSGRSFARVLEGSTDDLPLIGAPVDDAARRTVLSHAERRRLDRIADLALAAAAEAAEQADLEGLGVEPERVAIVAGIGFGGIQTLTAQHDILRDAGWRRGSPFGIPAVMPSAVAALLSMRYGSTGPATTVSSACASGTQAIAEAARLIWSGYADVVVAGGAEAPLDRLALAGFTRMDAMSRRVDDPERASRPFDVARDGFVMGEGAGFVVLCRGEHAAAAGRAVHGWVAGTGLTADAHHLTAPDGDGGGASRCVRAALAEAGLAPDDVVHVNAHGTGTPLNDRAEAVALGRALGTHRPAVTSCKGAIGHLMGGAGAVELVATVAAATRGIVPVTVNCDDLDPEIDLDVVRGAPREIPRGAALSTSFGFGGQNAALVVNPA